MAQKGLAAKISEIKALARVGEFYTSLNNIRGELKALIYMNGSQRIKAKVRRIDGQIRNLLSENINRKIWNGKKSKIRTHR